MNYDSLTLLEKHKVLRGEQRVYEHFSKYLNSVIRFAIFIPREALEGASCSCLYYLDGLGGDEQQMIQKGGFQRFANRHDMIVICPDTSPRGHDVANHESNYLGHGASFYLNATQSPWDINYQMYDYILTELPEIIERNFPANGMKSISGFSMGGYGALMIGLRNPTEYCSISAFAPLCSPKLTDIGKEVFPEYLGDNIDWSIFDPCELIKNSTVHVPLLIDQGDQDEYIDNLNLNDFEIACEQRGYEVEINYRKGYDHSYYFVRSFVMEHFVFHAEALESN